MNLNVKSFLPHAAAYALFIIISMIYFYPALQGNTLKMHDIQQFKGMSKELNDYRNETGEEALWTNSMFGGMPATQISVRHDSNILKKAFDVFTLWTPYPINILLMYMIGFYILLVCLRVNPWLAVIGAVAFGFSTYFIVILEAGHRSKAYAIAFMPTVLGAILYTYRRKLLLGAVLTAFFLAIEIAQNHLQITYYLVFVIVFVALAELIRMQKIGEMQKFIKASVLLVLAAIFAIGANLSNLWGTYEYGKETIRGKNELTLNQKAAQQDGLDIGYITNWCLGKEETASFLIPNAKGGKSASIIQTQEDLDAIEDPTLKNEILKIYQNGGYVNQYWGNQPGVSGPHYMGAIVLFLAMLSLVLIGDVFSWLLFAVTLLTIFLSWGDNLLWLTELFVKYVPMYNKFRAVTIILVVPAMIFPLLMVLFLQKLYINLDEIKQQQKKVLITSGVFAGVLLLFIALPQIFFSFLSDNEKMMFAENSPIVDYRIGIFRADAFRSLAFVVLAFVLIYGLLKAWFNEKIFVIGLLLLVLFDLAIVDKRYLHNEKNEMGEYEKWQPKDDLLMPFRATQGDMTIFQMEADKNPKIAQEVNKELQAAQQEAVLETGEPLSPEQKEAIMFEVLNENTNYRVYALGNSFNESRTSYFHKSIGGYHGAKLRKYQDLIEYQISRGNMDVLNMLNMKYVLRPDDKGGYQLNGGPNPQAMGNAWFVQDIHYVEDANEEMKALSNLYEIKAEKGVFVNGKNFSEGIISDLDTLEVGNIMERELIFLVDLQLPLDSTLIIGSDTLSDIQNASVKHPFSVKKVYDFNPRTTAVMREGQADNLSFEKDETAYIQLINYAPNHLTYEYTAEKEQFAVFSEVFYGKGWQAYIDGQSVEHYRVNYVLRGMPIPAGEHTIEFKFELKSFDVGSKVGYASSILILLLLVGVGFKALRS